MEFNTLAKTQLFPILKKHEFEIAEELKNIVNFKSTRIKINLVFNDFENSSNISIGRQSEFSYPINDNTMRNIFHSKLKIQDVTPEIFLQNLCVIFQEKEGIDILNGNIQHLIDFVEKEISDYNLEFMQQQTLKIALDAWEKKDYKAFLKSMDELDMGKVPIFYHLKYKIAKGKL